MGESAGMKEFRVIVRVKNNRLLERREKLGVTQDMMAEVIGLNKNVYASLENLRLAPVKGEQWTKEALRVAEYYNCDPDELFPEAVLMVREPLVERRLDACELVPPPALSACSEMMSLPPVEVLDRQSLAERIGSALSTLSPVEEDLLRRRYGLGDEEPKTFNELGLESGRSKERCRQIELRALWKLRHPDRRGVLDGGPVPEEFRAEREEDVRLRPPVREFRSMVELLEAWPGTLQMLRQVRGDLAAELPGRVRMRAALVLLPKPRLEVVAYITRMGEERLGELRGMLRYVGGPTMRLTLQRYEPPARGRGRLSLSRDAKEGGFRVLGRGARRVRLAVDPATDRLDQILLMRLWFCDRAERMESKSMTEVVWRKLRRAR